MSFLHFNTTDHLLTGLKKKLDEKGKKKGLEVIGAWSKSIANHVYWCAASSNGEGEVVVAKWLSMLNHIANIHSGHGQLYPECLHPELDARQWIRKGQCFSGGLATLRNMNVCD